MTSATCTDLTVDLILGEEHELRRTARRFVRCDSDADDLVQETLLRAYKARGRFEPGSSVRAWTTTILRRVFLTGARTKGRRRLFNDTDSDGNLESAVGRAGWRHDDRAPDIESIGEEFDDAVKQAFDGVPEIHRTALFLSAIWELSCRETAEHLRVPVGTAMSRIHRAREHLRGALPQHRSPLDAGGSRFQR